MRLGDPFRADTPDGSGGQRVGLRPDHGGDRPAPEPTALGSSRAAGGWAATSPSGYFIEPTVFADVAHRRRVFQHEVFGPVLSVTPFDDEAEAVELANDTVYGLAAYIQSRDIGRVQCGSSRN